MSATLTPKRKIGSRSAVASSIKWGDWGRERGDINASTEELEAGRRRITLKHVEGM
jgi:hypothetical protein